MTPRRREVVRDGVEMIVAVGIVCLIVAGFTGLLMLANAVMVWL